MPSNVDLRLSEHDGYMPNIDGFLAPSSDRYSPAELAYVKKRITDSGYTIVCREIAPPIGIIPVKIEYEWKAVCLPVRPYSESVPFTTIGYIIDMAHIEWDFMRNSVKAIHRSDPITYEMMSNEKYDQIVSTLVGMGYSALYKDCGRFVFTHKDSTPDKLKEVVLHQCKLIRMLPI